MRTFDTVEQFRAKRDEAVAFIQSKTAMRPEYLVILGTGLGDLVKKIKVTDSISYKDIPHFPVTTVESHAGRLLFGELGGKQVVAMQGRFHFYEGYSMQQIVFPVRVLQANGAKTLIVSNAAGGLDCVACGLDRVACGTRPPSTGGRPCRDPHPRGRSGRTPARGLS